LAEGDAAVDLAGGPRYVEASGHRRSKVKWIVDDIN